MTDRAELEFRMTVDDVFRFSDGRTVFVGKIDPGEDAILLPGKCELSVGNLTMEIEIQPEMLADTWPHGDRAVATSEAVPLPSHVAPA